MGAAAPYGHENVVQAAFFAALLELHFCGSSRVAHAAPAATRCRVCPLSVAGPGF